MRFSILLKYFLSFYSLLILIRCFLTWIPTIDWEAPLFKFIAKSADLFLYPFRRLIPPIGGLDFSPVVALLVLQYGGFYICRGFYMMGF